MVTGMREISAAEGEEAQDVTVTVTTYERKTPHRNMSLGEAGFASNDIVPCQASYTSVSVFRGGVRRLSLRDLGRSGGSTRVRFGSLKGSPKSIWAKCARERTMDEPFGGCFCGTLVENSKELACCL